MVVESGVPFNITYEVTNLGESDTAYGYLTKDGVEVPNTRWTAVINKNTTVPITTILTISSNLSAILHIGYVR
jgi:hypothetical protein